MKEIAKKKNKKIINQLTKKKREKANTLLKINNYQFFFGKIHRSKHKWILKKNVCTPEG